MPQRYSVVGRSGGEGSGVAEWGRSGVGRRRRSCFRVICGRSGLKGKALVGMSEVKAAIQEMFQAPHIQNYFHTRNGSPNSLKLAILIFLGLSSFLGYIYKYMYDVFGGIWMFVSSVLKVASSAEAATKHTYEVSLWRALWNDLFSQIFRATKSILYGVAAFFAACNRHRLSLLQHIQSFIGIHAKTFSTGPEIRTLIF